MKRYLLALALVACAPSFVMAQAAPTALTEHQIRTRLAEQGYTKINDLDFEDGVWKADARSADGNRVQVKLDPRSGRVYPNEQVAQMSERDVRAALSAAGYTDIHDVDYDDGIWLAKADDPAGRDVKLKLDPDNGKIFGVEKN